MHSGNNVRKVFVARNCTRTASLTYANMYKKLAYGEIIVTDQDGQIIDTEVKGKAASAIVIHQGTQDGGVIHSNLLRGKDIKSFKSSKFIQSKEKRVAIGYNGSSGTIEVIDDNNYFVTIEHKAESGRANADPFIHTFGYTSKTTGDTQYNIAKNLADLAVLNYSDYDDAPKVHVISATSGAGGSLTGCEVIQGSKTVTYTGGTLPTVGNVYVFDGVTGTPYRDELTSIYQAVSVDTVNGTITLDREYQNADQTGLSVAIIADTSLHAYGLMIEGTLQSFTLGRGGDLKMDFYTGLKNFGDTTLTDSGTGFDMIFSNGRYEKVAVDEWMYQGNAGRNSDQSREFQNASKASIVDHGYGSIEIESETSERISTVESNGQPINTTIYLDRSTYQDIEDDAVGCQFGDNIITGTGADTVDSTGVGSVVNVLNAFMVAHGIIATGLNATANEGCSLAGDGDFTAGVDF